MAEPVFRSALRGRMSSQKLAIGITEIVDRGMIDLRGEATDQRFVDIAQEVLGVSLPLRARSAESAGTVGALWLSVDQWLITMPRAGAGGLQRELARRLTGIHSLAVDMSDARTILRLEGDDVAAVLNKGTSVDFGTLAEGAVRRLRYAEIAALVHVIRRAPDVMDLYVFRSYADHAWRYLTTTGRAAARVQVFGRQG